MPNFIIQQILHETFNELQYSKKSSKNQKLVKKNSFIQYFGQIFYLILLLIHQRGHLYCTIIVKMMHLKKKSCKETHPPRQVWILNLKKKSSEFSSGWVFVLSTGSILPRSPYIVWKLLFISCVSLYYSLVLDLPEGQVILYKVRFKNHSVPCHL